MRKFLLNILLIILFYPIMASNQPQEKEGFIEFKSIKANSSLSIYYSQSPTYDVNVTGPKNLTSFIYLNIDKKGVLSFAIADVIKKEPLNDVKIYISSPNLEGITLEKESIFIFENDLQQPKSNLKINLNGNALINARNVQAKNVEIDMKDNTVFQGNIDAKSLEIDAKGNANINLSGNITKVSEFDLRDNTQLIINKLSGKKVELNSKGKSIANIAFQGKFSELNSSGNSTIQFSGIITKRSSLTATGNSIIDIRRLDSKSIKTKTSDMGIVNR